MSLPGPEVSRRTSLGDVGYLGRPSLRRPWERPRRGAPEAVLCTEAGPAKPQAMPEEEAAGRARTLLLLLLPPATDLPEVPWSSWGLQAGAAADPRPLLGEVSGHPRATHAGVVEQVPLSKVLP